MLWVIGTSFTVENAVKGLYENTVGRITEWISSGEQTDEDLFAYQMNKDYVAFIYDYPWYEFSFTKKNRLKIALQSFRELALLLKADT